MSFGDEFGDDFGDDGRRKLPGPTRVMLARALRALVVIAFALLLNN